MDISQYYDEAKKIGKLVEPQAPYVLAVLDYPPEEDNPSSWVPKVQNALLNFYKEFPSSDEAEKALNLYIQGAIMEDRAEHNLLVKIGASCLVLGVAIGWVIWS
ncbi:hypothetical protein [Microbulbifer sp. SSSA008]|uniref:hypothetical protein n=1 Tax=unclassified Microbulbifer TaxID=2619833 RepID=UPI0040394029